MPSAPQAAKHVRRILFRQDLVVFCLILRNPCHCTVFYKQGWVALEVYL